MGLYVEGDVPYVANGNGNYNNGWNDWSWIIGLAVVGGIFGNGGFGFGGGNRGNYATQADLSAGFANNSILSNLNDIILGQATMQNFINQGFAGLNSTITTGFAGVDNAVCTFCCATTICYLVCKCVKSSLCVISKCAYSIIYTSKTCSDC